MINTKPKEVIETAKCICHIGGASAGKNEIETDRKYVVTWRGKSIVYKWII